MSHDATYILIEGDQQQFFYSRWGGLHLDVNLLHGPEQFRTYLDSLQRTSRPAFEIYLCGLVEMDSHQRRLRYWGSQGFGSDPVSRRMYQALLKSQWAGWRLEWLPSPAKTMSAPSPRIHAVDVSIQEIQTWQTEPWQEAQATLPDFDKLIASGQADTVRSWFELDFTTWVTLQTENGWRDEVINSGWPDGYCFLLGTDLLQVLEVRPQRTLDQLWIAEKDIRACCLIDAPNRCFWWWQLYPAWRTIWEMEQAWPGWETRWLEQGPASQLELTGREPQALLSPDCVQTLEKWFSRLLGPGETPSQILATTAASLRRRPDEEVLVTPPGPGSEGIAPSTAWTQRLTNTFTALLSTAAFQPKRFFNPESPSS